jgi:hypothetical protein
MQESMPIYWEPLAIHASNTPKTAAEQPMFDTSQTSSRGWGDNKGLHRQEQNTTHSATNTPQHGG